MLDLGVSVAYKKKLVEVAKVISEIRSATHRP